MTKITLKKKEKKELEQNAIRRCNSDCYFFKNGGEGCQYFQAGEAKLGEPCLHDMVQLKQYSEAFMEGNLEFIKGESSAVTGMLMMQVKRMLEQVQLEGVTLDEPIVDGKGNPIRIPDPNWNPASGVPRENVIMMRKVEHPLIQRAIQLAKSIGINLADFKLTPKSADEKKMVSGHIIAENPVDIKEAMEESRKNNAKFIEAVKRGSDRTKEDPVYKALRASGEIVGE